jgi:hypothetical protein
MSTCFFTYSSIKEHFTSIVGIEGNKSYNRQSLQLKNNGFWVWGGSATANPSKISLSQFWTMSTFHMVRALLTETMFKWNIDLLMTSCYFFFKPQYGGKGCGATTSILEATLILCTWTELQDLPSVALSFSRRSKARRFREFASMRP